MSSPSDPRISNVPDTERTEAAHSAEQALIDARRTKAARVRARGENPFANDLRPSIAGAKTYDLCDVRACALDAKVDGKYLEEKVRGLATGKVFHVRGRVVALRSTG